ncbi:zinc metalloproteinase/disintegrin-like [Ixodes scapularis]|uniref:zinc metalloproteinase/disintegrin-like n=1 Tax=Ixodes scapularis TaxID=6945 RepID=UPI001A9E654B|nr:zinc metalloproteinase/disintegrin-like [Ixodes scapularis]
MARGSIPVLIVLYCAIYHSQICNAGILKNRNIFPTLIEERSSAGELTLRINQDLVLNLRRTSVFSDTIQLSSFDGDTMLTRNVPSELIEKNLYHDTERGAAVMVSDTDGLRVEGIIGDRLRISSTNTAERNAAGHLAHRIFEIERQSSEGNDISPQPPNAHLLSTGASKNFDVTAMERAQSGTKVIITPEVHLLIDSKLTKQFNNTESIASYYAIFAAFVNLKFKTLEEPLDVQLVIAKITTYTETSETFVKKAPKNENVILTDSLAELKNFITTRSEFKTDDLVILLTGHDIAFYNSVSQKVVSEWTSGYAYAGGACRDTKVGMVEDKANMFTGTHTFTHEVGHLLGMSHDGQAAPNHITNSPGATKCKPSDGYIMAPVHDALSYHMFSVCSAEQLLAFQRDPQTTCFNNTPQRHNKPLKDDEIRGMAVSAQKYCETQHPGTNVTYLQSYNGSQYDLMRCEIICSWRVGHLLYTTFYDAPDNTLCDEKDKSLVCINKDCIHIPTDLKTFTATPRTA